MRGDFFLVIGMALLIGLAPQSAHAAGNVLLPSDTSSSSGASSSLPNLGLAVPAPAPAPSTEAAPPQAPTTAPPSLTGGQTPAPTPAPVKESDIITPIDKESASHLPPGVMPTIVIHQPVMPDFLPPGGDPSLPYMMTVSIAGQSIFGASDVQTITTKLGLSRAQIPSNCILTLRGIMQTDKGTYLLDGGASPQVPVRYDGVISRYMMGALALCTAGKLPPGSGFLTETGDRYNISLQPITCPPPNRQAAQLVITYTGTDKSQCAYQ